MAYDDNYRNSPVAFSVSPKWGGLIYCERVTGVLREKPKTETDLLLCSVAF